MGAAAVRLLAVSILLIGCGAEAEEARTPPLAGREVPARELPVPTTVSPGLAKIIAAPPDPIAFENPQTPDAWRALVKKHDNAELAPTKALWKELGLTVTPLTIAGVKCFRLDPAEVPPENKNRLLVHLHGGAYVMFGGVAATGEAALIAGAMKVSVISVDYRMPPEHPFPAALDDAVAVWREIIKDHEPARTALFGSSAGGGLTMATVLKLKPLGAPLPGALFLGSPWADLSKTGDSYFANDRVDNSLVTYRGLLEGAAKLYAGDNSLKEPLISPLYGDLHGFPPSILISGTRDLLLSLTVRTHRALKQAGAEADIDVFEGQSHVEYLSSFPAPESKEALAEIAKFFDEHLGQ